MPRPNKIIREFMKREEGRGWEIADRAGSGHWVVIHRQTGAMVFLPSSPSDHRSLLNCSSKMRRAVQTKMSHKE